jgi:hypothetical protein
MRQFIRSLFWILFVTFAALASRAERAEGSVCSTVGQGPVCGYSYDVICNPQTFECKPIIYEYRQYIDRPTSGPAPY